MLNAVTGFIQQTPGVKPIAIKFRRFRRGSRLSKTMLARC